MFDFLKRKKEKKEKATGASKPPKEALERGVPPVKTAAIEPPKPSPARSPSATAADEEGFKVGQTLRVPGLGDFLVHDIKGGKGKSGMGIVYIVIDASTTTPFAVKTFQRWCLNTPDMVHRFLREAETWVKLEQHQNIVRAYYVATLQDQPYVFLEYVAGADLRKKLAAGALPPRDALRYSIQFCRGMAHAQQKVPGLVHRDIKPENCMFTPDGVLKVTDFGLVKVLAGSDRLVMQAPVQEELAENQSQLFKTRLGEMGVGTLPYMAPEQFTEFSQVSVKADIYSFGVMLYEMLAGRRPFRVRSRDPEQWYAQHRNIMPPEPSFVRPEVGVALSRLTMRCLAKSPEERYPDFATVERELSAILKKEYQEEVSSAGVQELEAWEVLNKGTALSNLGRTREALDCFDKALEIMPRFDAAWLNKGVILFKEGKASEALECYDKAIEINPNSAAAWYNRGTACQKQQKLEDALACYDRALELDSLNEATWLNKGVLLRKLQRAQEAVECYDRILTLNSNSAVAWYNRGFALRQMGRSQEEMECYKRAVEINPRFLEAWLNQGTVLRKLNRFIEALFCYDRVLDIQPRHADAWYNKGIVHRKLGQKREAQSAFQKAAALDPKVAEELKRQGLQ
ncbi:MAG: tetratricopeptide repeat protein [Acidobacteria bacterium]|nr:tetratricopeptide repeat protein [Acidobacteriota bacterium]